ncbi:MAG TPA: hypothetical protein VJ784_09995 [Pyrinomonadaceae bacterium]|nr:hypothetical protein [Pyrinomonadaceae bacterium]
MGRARSYEGSSVNVNMDQAIVNLDRVSTTCGSGWVRSGAATDAINAGVNATHPPATAGGTDPVQ